MAGMNGSTHSEGPRASPVCGKRTDLGKSPLLELPLLGSPSPCPPGLYQGLRHSTGTRVGRQGLEESPLPVRCCGRHCFTMAFCLLPGCRGRGSCQRKWACIKASRKGQGPVGGKGGHRPSWEPASHPGVETPSRGGASPRVTGDMDPEESEANC